MDGLKPFLQAVNCTVLSANIKAVDPVASQIYGYYSASKILQVDNEKVGIVGYTSRETPALSMPGIVLKVVKKNSAELFLLRSALYGVIWLLLNALFYFTLLTFETNLLVYKCFTVIRSFVRFLL